MRYKDPFNSTVYSIIPQNKLKRDLKKTLLFELLESFNFLEKKEKNDLICKTIEEIKSLVEQREEKTDNKLLSEKNEAKEYIEKIKKIFSFDEMSSGKKITPYHISLFVNQTEEIQKTKGEFNTPYYIGKFLHNQIFSFYQKEKKKSLLDISEFKWADLACGTGNLLLANLYEIKKKNDNGSKVQGKFFEQLLKNMYATDIDPLSLAICRLRILIFFAYFFPEIDIQKQDIKLEKKNALIKERKEPTLDYILLNPPFMTYGLRNGQEYKEEFKQYLRSNYSSAEYKLPLYTLFIERSLELLKEGGLLGVITPDSFLLGRYYSKIRKYIRNTCKIKKISLLDYEAFDKVTLGRTAISFYEKKEKVKEQEKEKNNEKEEFYACFIPSYAHFINENNNIGYQNNLYRKWFGKNKFNRFYLFFDEKEEEIVRKWFEKAEKRLEELVTIHTGIRSKVGQKNIIHTKKLGDKWKKGLIQGKQVLPYYCDYKGHWLNINRCLLWSGGFKLEIVEKPKILLRQTGYRLVACVDTNGFYHLNNIHSLTPKKKKVDLYSLAVILNSEEFNQVYQILSMEKGRTFAQIDMDFLLEMPIIELTKEQKEKLRKFYFRQKEKQEKGKKIDPTKLTNLLKQ